ncbi:MAG: ABC transporter ATP-binding protein [Xanthomonadales bacterium]|nr:ABC transporter ATP-binding protein [Xanthomonadales bacterium]
MIELKQLRRTYQIGAQTIHALDGVDMQIAEGEFLAIMGRSGSGKSTLLNMLGCMDRPDGGSYQLDSKAVSEMDDDQLSEFRNRYIGFIFQSFHLLPRLTTLENVLLPRRYHDQGFREEDRERAVALLKRVDLGDRLDHKPNELSGGQRQRVAIARSLINEPRLLLADEPTGNLDSRTSDAIMDLLQELNRDGQTIVMVTHEQDIANFAQRQVHMMDGSILREERHAKAIA